MNKLLLILAITLLGYAIINLLFLWFLPVVNPALSTTLILSDLVLAFLCYITSKHDGNYPRGPKAP